ncbi:MAG: tRNA (5-methylaminomethyl-2-thiouridine)(34)-methyltransferase MnmD [Pedobacter sp.]|uniref:tRNA (5-methylaminomethyl-2-thiouridine)(34)-methyltransferase MnmD n=1 Tax=Pedobacter sp. TaxID=1411316 RepID=UPI002808CF6E|nr:tRNA (5-methylaminomethyl-2-thiouridine)(34)-methyltransferase MnmD [Pedobacter sp.]MDQ8006270.1 tRNA (5-methylaminomethyl-2-thiouridine)(34)-methyltransferase MnmD [Pedobacter sp.]
MNILTPTADGSNTLFNEEIGEHYHSSHGALQESKHVFIEAGLKHGLEKFEKPEIDILEVGFGTGLNFLLSYAQTEEACRKLNYHSIEAFPLTKETLVSTEYQQYVPQNIWNNFIEKYQAVLDNSVEISTNCTLEISHTTLQNFSTEKRFDILYFDAFSVRHQPELWTNEMIAHACSFLKPGGIFVTYAITGNLKRAVKSCGFSIEKLPGAPGKREMLRAIKTI